MAPSGAGEGEQGEPLRWTRHKGSWVLIKSADNIDHICFCMFLFESSSETLIYFNIRFHLDVVCVLCPAINEIHNLVLRLRHYIKMCLPDYTQSPQDHLSTSRLFAPLIVHTRILINDLFTPVQLLLCAFCGCSFISGGRPTSPRKSPHPAASVSRGWWDIWWLLHRGAETGPGAVSQQVSLSASFSVLPLLCHEVKTIYSFQFFFFVTEVVCSFCLRAVLF